MKDQDGESKVGRERDEERQSHQVEIKSASEREPESAENL